jgi:hypothetical protein
MQNLNKKRVFLVFFVVSAMSSIIAFSSIAQAQNVMPIDSMMTPAPNYQSKAKQERPLDSFMIPARSPKPKTPKKPSNRVGYVADFQTQMAKYEDIVNNEDTYRGKTFTWKAEVYKNDEGRMVITDQGFTLLSVYGSFPDGIIYAVDENGHSWNSSEYLPHISAGDNVAVTGKLVSVGHFTTIKATFAVFTVTAAKILY